MALPTMRLATDAKRKLPRKVSLTKNFVEGLRCPPDQRELVVYDTHVKGFCVHVTKRNKNFFMYRKQHGRPKRWLIGPFPDKSVENARPLDGKLCVSLAEAAIQAAVSLVGFVDIGTFNWSAIGRGSACP